MVAGCRRPDAAGRALRARRSAVVALYRKVLEAHAAMEGRETEFETLLGVLTREAHRLPSTRSRNTTKKYKRLAKELRLLPSDVVETTWKPCGWTG